MNKNNAFRLTTVGAVGGAAALGAYLLAVRPWMLHWGATCKERRETLPGDELIPSPKHRDTHAITIQAPVEEVWPWLVQIGQDKGGFYSYAFLENMVGCHLHNVDRIVPEYQTLKAGDPVRLHPNAPPLVAMIVEPYRAIVLVGGEDKSVIPPTYEGTWAFHVRAVDSHTTRLLIRSRWNWKPGFASWFGYRCLLEPAHFIMEQKMMRTIKSRVEHTGCEKGAITAA